MKKELEALDKQQLINIAKQYGLRNTESMTKKQIIHRVLEIEGIENVQEKEVVMKSKKPYLMMFIFILILLIELVGSVMPMFNRFYFNLTGGNHWIYLMIMNVLSFIWMLYIWYRWAKYGQLHMWIFMSLVMGLGYDIYYFVQFHDTVKQVATFATTAHHWDQMSVVFWVWVSLLSALSGILAILLLTKTIRDK